MKDQPSDAFAHIMRGLGLALKSDKDDAMVEVKTWLPKLNFAETDEAQKALGGASEQYPDNAALAATYELIPDKTEDDDDMWS